MDRRVAVVHISWILKSAFLTPAVSTLFHSCRDEVANAREMQILKPGQNESIIAMADTIVPRTDTPSASDVRVNHFIDLLLKDVFDRKTRSAFLQGLSDFDEKCKARTGSDFYDLDEQRRFQYLSKVDQQIMGRDYGERVPFYYSFKHLVITSYFSTKEGVRQNLDYKPVPGPYKGEVDCHGNTRIMIGNYM
ncbi:gluconate 2-dehydrogenase subunit 3 family protein [Flagellimonas algicola]|uniref:Gluconate 2-dehydrogenase subunit 3 family protein n=1 Tax=Flagellimonas algicola TaxID=2583815 RepID=A0ABY2WGM6_9FLAO|nr:gluconate 2-dehydrogenase subunit 3 family protein [Allomuricauda algicola]TMU50705.1 gluconate 2-dehydrogenase subunit 3 family protein [Allomuricauda algicola]